ncbi:MAG: nucleotidyltransferase domain-containing protein, partial [Methylococcales bacterium]|nr:nucleotidyltransferase domain-containing protein [Methylococcales bacterium]
QITKSVQASFGDVDIYLFGSRTDDAKKGGDIDIAVDVNLPMSLFREKKIQFISNLMKAGFDLKVDIVIYNNDNELFRNEIVKSALKIN